MSRTRNRTRKDIIQAIASHCRDSYGDLNKRFNSPRFDQFTDVQLLEIEKLVAIAHEEGYRCAEFDRED